MEQEEKRRPIILVIEDEPIVLETVAVDLQESGFDVVRASSGEDAQRLLEADGRLDIIMTDIGLPGSIDGWQVATLARAARPKIPVIYVTGAIDDDPRKVAGSRIVAKPYSLDGLIEAARALGVKIGPL